MRLFFLPFVYTGLALSAAVERRQNNGHMTETQLEKGGCKKITLIFARGSTEMGNMGSYVGPYLADALTKEYGKDLAVQGVNYAASWFTNYIGGDPAGATEMIKMLNLASSKCPDTIIIASGYSQGGGIMHNSINKVPANVRDKIAAVVVFGDTYQVRDKEQIPGFPKDKFMAICSTTDLVCHDPTGDFPVIMPAHMLYSSDVPKAVAFIKQKVSDVQRGGSPSSSSSSGSASPAQGFGSITSAKGGKRKGTPGA